MILGNEQRIREGKKKKLKKQNQKNYKIKFYRVGSVPKHIRPSFNLIESFNKIKNDHKQQNRPNMNL